MGADGGGRPIIICLPPKYLKHNFSVMRENIYKKEKEWTRMKRQLGFLRHHDY